MSDLPPIIGCSIDGGGIHGIRPATWLNQVSSQMGKPIHEIFDILCGTSTGGVLAAGLGLGIPSYQVLNLYQTQARAIFGKPASSFTQWHRPKYKTYPLRSVLHRYMGDKVLGDVLTRVMITAYNTDGHMSYFKSWADHEKGLPLVDICTATSAAPTFFSKVRIERPEAPASSSPVSASAPRRTSLYVDGGVGNTNPSVSLYAEMRRLWPDRDLILISMGTGSKAPVPEKTDDRTRRWGRIQWLTAGDGKDLISTLLTATGSDVVYQMESIALGDVRFRYLRKDVLIDNKHMDETDPDVIHAAYIQALEEGVDDILQMIS